MEELKLVGERAETLLPHCDVLPVCSEAQCHISPFGVLAVELHFQQVFPGDQVAVVVNRGDFILENEVVIILLQSERLFIQSSKLHQ